MLLRLFALFTAGLRQANGRRRATGRRRRVRERASEAGKSGREGEREMDADEPGVWVNTALRSAWAPTETRHGHTHTHL